MKERVLVYVTEKQSVEESKILLDVSVAYFTVGSNIPACIIIKFF